MYNVIAKFKIQNIEYIIKLFNNIRASYNKTNLLIVSPGAADDLCQQC